MGWWGTGVMEGDGPMDFAGYIEDALATGLRRKRDCDLTAKSRRELALRYKDPARIQQILAMDHSSWSVGDDDQFYQVLGYLVMQAGGPIESFKDKLIQAVENDEWAQEDDEREQKMQAFLAQIHAYNNTPVELNQSRGLFQVISEKLAGTKRDEH